jgi:hypothetical protein
MLNGLPRHLGGYGIGGGYETGSGFNVLSASCRQITSVTVN